jgi:hypothetical protein
MATLHNATTTAHEASASCMGNSGWEQIGTAGGIVFVALQMASQALIQVGGAEPPFDAPADTIATFFMARDSQLFGLGDYLSSLSLIAFLWFLGSLWSALRRGEGEPAWLSHGLRFDGCRHGRRRGRLAPSRFQERSGFGSSDRPAAVRPGQLRICQYLGDAGESQPGHQPGEHSNAHVSALAELGRPADRRGLAGRACLWASSALVFIPFMLCYLWLIAISVVLIRGASAGQPGPRMPTAQQL